MFNIVNHGLLTSINVLLLLYIIMPILIDIIRVKHDKTES